ncbi:MAG TPA: sugar kinase, partial [Chloroflexota bacterium]|nr:sugar kinase [Chloroflexota bacterium]
MLYTGRPMSSADVARVQGPFHLVSFGEAMVRLCPPGFGRLEVATQLEMQPGGAELNTAVGLARLGAEQGLRAAWVSRLPRSPLGRYIAAKAREQGVVTDYVAWDDGADARCGTYFLEEGAAPRASSVLYDRANSSCARLDPQEFDWAQILTGAHYFLVTGITPAVSPSCLEATRQAMRAAQRAGVRVVFDPNFRSKLWTLEQARAVYLELAPLVDILSCSEEGLRTFYGVPQTEPAPAQVAIDRFDLQAVIMTTRVELGMWRNRVGATVLARGPSGAVTAHHDREREVEIVDRLGAGDAFVAGFLYGLLTSPDGDALHPDWERATAYGGACAALKHSIRG